MSCVLLRCLSLLVSLVPRLGPDVVAQAAGRTLLGHLLQVLILLESVSLSLRKILLLLLGLGLSQCRVIDLKHLLSDSVVVLLPLFVEIGILVAFRGGMSRNRRVLLGRSVLRLVDVLDGSEVVSLALLLRFLTFSLWILVAKPDDLVLQVRLVQVAHQVIIWTLRSHHLLVLSLLLRKVVGHVLLRVGQGRVASLEMLK